MDDIFLVFGYGVPKDIRKDEKYNFYLKMIFNHIFRLSSENKNAKPIVIFCGGKTDCFKPYRRTEADEMLRLFASISAKSYVRNITKNWICISEKKSISTLENFLYSKKIIQKNKIEKADIRIFCEQTRGRRIKKMSKIIFGNNYKIKVYPIDFDTSRNRYLDGDFIAKKEREELKHGLRALKNKENLKKHHRFFVEKLNLCRHGKSKSHEGLIRKWWEKQLENSKEI